MRRLENWKPDDENDAPRGRRVYVRFECSNKLHTGPFFGPYVELEMRGKDLIGNALSGRDEIIASMETTGWVVPGRDEPPYVSFTVVPS